MRSVPLGVDLRKEVLHYKEFGLITLPLKPNTMVPLFQDWQFRSPTEMWSQPPEDANIGIRIGGVKRVAVIEFSVGSNGNSYKNIVDWLDRLGVNQGAYPVIHSTSNNRRYIYISLADELPGQSYPLAPEIGDGELYYGSETFVIAPPSTTINGDYKLLQGDFSNIPVLKVEQIIKLLDLPIPPSWLEEGSKPLNDNDLYGIPARVLALIQGDGVDTYKDRLDLEQAIVISLIKKGYSNSQILSIFLNYPVAGKFREVYDNNTETGLKWLRLLIESSRELVNSNKSIDHQLALEAIAWAESTPWPGRAGPGNQAVLIAHGSIAFKRGQLIYGASIREIAELSGITRTTASNATKRLIDDGRISLVEPTVGLQANFYDLVLDVHNGTILSIDCPVMHSHDAFRWSGLGKSAALVWNALNQNDSLTVAEVETITGKAQSTIRRRLSVMASIQDPVTGDVIPMVVEMDQNGANRWRALDVDLEHIAEIIGTKGTGDEQKRQHKKEQKLFVERLSRSQKGKPTVGL